MQDDSTHEKFHLLINAGTFLFLMMQLGFYKSLQRGKRKWKTPSESCDCRRCVSSWSTNRYNHFNIFIGYFMVVDVSVNYNLLWTTGTCILCNSSKIRGNVTPILEKIKKIRRSLRSDLHLCLHLDSEDVMKVALVSAEGHWHISHQPNVRACGTLWFIVSLIRSPRAKIYLTRKRVLWQSPCTDTCLSCTANSTHPLCPALFQ